MKSLFAATLLLAVGGLVAAHWPSSHSPAQASRPMESGWRRTADGWERLMPPAIQATSVAWCDRLGKVHPLVIAAVQALVSLGVLIAACPARQPSPSTPRRPHRRRVHHQAAQSQVPSA